VEEISTKFGWIRNSATLATIAPWLLLLLLSTQEGTRNAFATMEGAKILMAGVFMTGIAYLWMEKVGSLPVPERALR
jgi:tight adherence protein B